MAKDAIRSGGWTGNQRPRPYPGALHAGALHAGVLPHHLSVKLTPRCCWVDTPSKLIDAGLPLYRQGNEGTGAEP